MSLRSGGDRRSVNWLYPWTKKSATTNNRIRKLNWEAVRQAKQTPCSSEDSAVFAQAGRTKPDIEARIRGLPVVIWHRRGKGGGRGDGCVDQASLVGGGQSKGFKGSCSWKKGEGRGGEMRISGRKPKNARPSKDY